MSVLEILNVGLGDMRVTWDSDDDAEVARAQTMIEDLMRQGYAILVEQEDGTHARAVGFDRNADAYIIGEREAPDPAAPKKKRPYRRQQRRGSTATAVARSAGG